MLNAGYVDVQDYVKNGWLTGVRYEDEIFDDLVERTGSDKDKLKTVNSFSREVVTSPEAQCTNLSHSCEPHDK